MLDSTKFEAAVYSDVNGTNRKHEVVGILDVDGEPNALELLVEEPMTDNTTIKVEFKDKRSTNSVISSSNTVYCKLTDGYQPSALKVNVINNRTLEVEFSEAVLRGDDAEGTENEDYAADLFKNYAIDARDLRNYGVSETPGGSKEDNDNDKDNTGYKISEKDFEESGGKKEGTVSVGRYDRGEDNRNIVTIRLGEGHALKSGRHSLAISNVGDWAAATDGWRNILQTATVDFVVPDAADTPSFDWEVMSPEQFKLTANCEFTLADGKTFTAQRSNTAAKEVVIKLQEQRGSDWVTISASTNIATTGDGYNPIMVSRIKDSKTGLPTNEYLVETTRDWTDVLNTRSTNQSYYNKKYRLRIDANQIRNDGNDKWNQEININLYENPVMQNIDGTSPTITSIEQIPDDDGKLTNNYQVTFSEPVKMSDGSNGLSGANKEGMTPKQGESAASMYSAYFVKKDSSLKSVEGKVHENSFVDATDTTIQVSPVSELDAGDWDLYVRGVADDYGNTVPTLNGTITVEAQTVTSDFKVVWAAVSEGPKYNQITEGEGGYIFVKFNKPINLSGGSVNASSTLNYQINGQPLPTGSYIRANIAGYDTDTNGVDSITIVLPQGSGGSLGGNTLNNLVNGSRAILTISSALTSQEGIPLTTEAGYNLPYQYGEAPKFSLRTDNDAVWGNDPTEQGGEAIQNIKTAKDYIAALKKALADNKYREVRIDVPSGWLNSAGRFDLGDEELKINRIVDIDLNGTNIYGNITIDTEDEADKVSIVNSKAGTTAVVYGKKEKTSENGVDTAALIVNTPYTSVRLANSVKFDNGNSEYSMIIQGVTSDTLLTSAEITGNVLITGNGVGLQNDGTINGNIEVDTTGTVYLKGDYQHSTITLAKKVTLNLANITQDTTVVAKIKDSTVVVNDIDAKVTVIAAADDVIVRFASADDVELETENGSFKQQNLKGEALGDSEKADVSSTDMQGFIESLHVIDGSEPGGLVEIITASAASPASITFTHDGNENIVSSLIGATSSEETPAYKVTGVSIDTIGSNLTYNKDKGSVTYRVPTTGSPLNEIRFTFEVLETATNSTRTITKTVKVTKK